MSDSPSTSLPSIPYSTLLMLLLAVSGLLAVRADLSSDRPDQETAPTLPLPGEQDIDARLWQDPFGAFTTFEDLGRDRSEPERRLKLGRHVSQQLDKLEKLAVANPDRPKRKLLLLPVLVPGGPYSEDSETRRRARIAVLSSLLSQGYLPRSSELIGSFTFRGHGGSTGTWSTPVPYEWMQRDRFVPNETGLPDSILILWLQERALSAEPIARTEQIAAEPLALHLGNFPDHQTADQIELLKKHVRVAVIGPANSGTLAAMVQEGIDRIDEVKLRKQFARNISATPAINRDGPNRAEKLIAAELLQVADRYLPFGLPRPRSVELLNELAREVRNSRPSRFTLAALRIAVLERLGSGLSSPADEDAIDRALASALGEVFGTSVTTATPEGWRDVVVSFLPREVSNSVWRPATDTIPVDQKKLAAQLQKAGELGRQKQFANQAMQYVQQSLPPPALVPPEANEEEPRAPANAEPTEATRDSAIRRAAESIGRLAALRDEVIRAMSPRSVVFSPRATVPSKFLFSDQQRLDLLRQFGDLLPEGTNAASVPRFSDIPLWTVFRRHPDLNTGAPNPSRHDRTTIPTRFARTICTDDQLAVALLDELEKRGVRPHESEHHIALIKESESLYGSTIRRTFAHVATDRELRRQGLDASDPNAPHRKATQDRSLKLFHEFGYLRGLDGQLPADRNDGQTMRPDQSVGIFGTPQRAGAQDLTPFGRNQFDSVSRLASAIRTLDEKLHDECGDPRPIRAIGVVGSDIYDKLLILAALREKFPNKLFFTVDLDARLVMTKRLAETQNLIIASGFGLELRPELQGAIGAYRDSYQTSTHLAVLRALNVKTPPLQGNLFGEAWSDMLKPRVFEVGRTKAIDLTVNLDRNTPQPIFQPRKPQFREWILTAMVIAVLLLGLFRLKIRPLQPSVAGRNAKSLISLAWMQKQRGATWFVLGLLSIPMAAIFVGVLDHTQRGHGEPAYLAEGVSLWPTEFLRILATMATVVLISVTMAQVAAGNRKLGERFFGMDTVVEADPVLRRPWRLLRWLRARAPHTIPRRLLERQDEHPARFYQEDLQQLWRRYLELCLPEHRFARIAPYVLVLSAAALTVILYPPAPLVPYRGDFAYYVDVTATVLVVTGVVTLCLFVIDAIRLALSFTRTLSGAICEWEPTEYTHRIGEARGVRQSSIRTFVDLLVVARQSKVHGQLLGYPFVVLFIMVFAQYGTFDTWRWPLLFVAVVAALAATVLANGVFLVTECRKARLRCLRRMREQLSQMQSEGDTDTAGFEMLLEDATEIREGAFSNFASNPVVNAVIFPSGGLGALSLLDLLNRALS